MRSNVPIGFALSGGLDSSVIVCTARMLEPNADLRTFTYAASGWATDESRWAKIVSDDTRSDAPIIRLPQISMVSSLEHIVVVHGAPMLTASAVAQGAVLEAAHNAGVKVTQDGQGADEIFASYPRYLGQQRQVSCLADAGRAFAACLGRDCGRHPDGRPSTSCQQH